MNICKKKFNIELLNSIVLRDNPILIGDYPYLSGRVEIKYKCSCNNDDIIKREFRNIVQRGGGMRCKECVKKNRIIKMKNTNLERYGVESVAQVENIKKKKVDICLKKYGVEYISQKPEILEKIQKNSKKLKEYKMPSGKIIKIQGYEPWALDELLKIYNEEKIITSKVEVPKILYNENNKKHLYFPDIYIPQENKIIEVKSTWTYKKYLYNVNLKAKATRDMGYNYEIWCYDGKKNKIIY